MLKVGIEGRTFRSFPLRGIAAYTRRMIEEMALAFPADRRLLLVPGQALAPAAPVAGVELRRTHVSGRFLHTAAALTGRPRLDRLLPDQDVIWLPAVTPVALSGNVPFVLTVHDLSVEHRPGDYSPYERLWHRLARPRRLAARAARVVTVSEAVRAEVVAEWGLAESAVVAIPSGPGREPGAPASLPPEVPPKYLLAVGALEPRKRLDVLLRAHALARSRGLSAALVLAGEGPLRDELTASGATVLGHVSDGVLDALYGSALALVSSSAEEGFGFTPVEALRRGTPAVVSDLPPYGETVANAVLRFPPGDVEALAEALLRIEGEPALRRELVDAGGMAVAQLSWRRAAVRLRDLLVEVAA